MKELKKTTIQDSVNSVEELLYEVEKNARSDRNELIRLYNDLGKNVKKVEDHQMFGYLAAKYMESATRSNDQLMRIAMAKIKISENNDPINMSKDDIESLIEQKSSGAFK